MIRQITVIFIFCLIVSFFQVEFKSFLQYLWLIFDFVNLKIGLILSDNWIGRGISHSLSLLIVSFGLALLPQLIYFAITRKRASKLSEITVLVLALTAATITLST